MQRVALAVAGVLAAPLVLAWTLVGWFCALHWAVLQGAGWIILLAVLFTNRSKYETEYTFKGSMIDAVAVVAVFSCLCGAVAVWARAKSADPRIPLLLPAVVCAFLVVKLCVVPDRLLLAWLGVALAFSVLLYLNCARVWVPASLGGLERAERGLLEKHAGVPFAQSVIAGLGTIEVLGADSCSSGERRSVESVGREGSVKESSAAASLLKGAELGGNGVAAGGGAQGGKPVLVLVHGYAAGNVFWMFNLRALSESFRVYAVELFGCGRSVRGPFRAKGPQEAEEIFAGALELWRQELGLGKFVLCGHSLGAMVASAYCMKWPDHVSKLVLASPVGVGHPPMDDMRLSKSFIRRVFGWGWSKGLTPMTLVRWAGPFGYKLTRLAVGHRLSWMPEGSTIEQVDVDQLSRYCYYNWALGASGEKALSSMLLPGAYARRPLMDSLKHGDAGVKCPITFIYGSPMHDWMDQRFGHELAAKLNAEGGKVEVFAVSNAGHQVFLDNPGGFNDIFIKSVRKALQI